MTVLKSNTFILSGKVTWHSVHPARSAIFIDQENGLRGRALFLHLEVWALILQYK